MKTKLATLLSVSAVLAAGSVAALVNTAILDGEPRAAGASAAIPPPVSSVDVTVPDVTVSTLPVSTTILTAPAQTVASTAAPTTQGPAPERLASSLTAFNVGDAGVVTVDVIDGHIVLVSAEPKAGWAVATSTEDSDANDVRAEFVGATMRVEFRAVLVDGTIVPTVTSSALTAPTDPAPPASSASGGSDGGGDDDEVEHEQRDDDHAGEIEDGGGEREDD